MGRTRVKPQIIVNSIYGNKDFDVAFCDFIKSIVLQNEVLKSSLDTIGTSDFINYNQGKDERRK